MSRSESENTVALRRSRKLIRHSISELSGALQLGSFVIIAYKLNKPSRKIRKTMQRALQRAPYFKLCPSVYAFPQLRRPRANCGSNTFDHLSDRHRITTPKQLVEMLTGFDARILKMSRLVVLTSQMEKILVERMKSSRRTQCRKLTQACKNLMDTARLQGSEYFSAKALKLKLCEIRYRYRAVRAVLGFFRREMGIDLSDELMRVSRAISSCHQALRRLEERRASVAANSTI